jgi:hypothetical protein
MRQWAETKRLLQAVIVELQTQIEPEQLAWVTEYLEHNELGLAYESLVEAIRDRQLTLDAKGAAALDAARRLMKIKA